MRLFIKGVHKKRNKLTTICFSYSLSVFLCFSIIVIRCALCFKLHYDWFILSRVLLRCASIDLTGVVNVC